MSQRAVRPFLIALGLILLRGSSAAAEDNNLIYQIFVRSFADSNGDGVGDIRGISQRLDYLNDGRPETDSDLEVGILWLMPVLKADSYHGYDVSDYEAIEQDYGNLDDLKELLTKAHQRHLRIILDVPFNHTSVNHAWFRDAAAGNEQLRNRYFFRSNNQPLSHQWHRAQGTNLQYFGLFDRSMPDLNFENADVRSEVKRIARFWLELGVDGFRLDAAKHIFGDSFGSLSEPQILRNNDWWLEFSNHCRSINPNVILVGEVLGGHEALRRHAYGLEALLDEPFMHDSRNQMSFPQPGFVGRHKANLRAYRDVNQLAPHMPDRPFDGFLFVGSHDENPRLASYLEEAKRRGMPAEVEQAYRVGMYLLMTIGRTPIIYSGEELMQRGFKWNGNGDGSGIFDETLREPFPWHKSGQGTHQTTWFSPRFDHADDGISVEEQETDGSMLRLIRALANIRTAHPGLANGELGGILTDSHDWMVFERSSVQGRYLVLINPTPTGKDYAFHAGWHPQYIASQLVFWSDGSLRRFADETRNNKHIDRTVFVPPYGLVVLRR